MTTDALTVPRPDRRLSNPVLRRLLAVSWDLIRSHAPIFGVLAIWTLAPLVVIAVHVAAHGGVMTAAYGDDSLDQFQYLAWIRDEGTHFLASNLWAIGASPHDYLQPMYLISGLLWQLGLSIQLAYLLWAPVSLVVLFVGAAAYMRRHLEVEGRWAVTAGLVLALIYHSPVYAISRWAGHLSFAHQFQLLRATADADPVLQLWGLAHAALAIGLMPICLLATERLLARSRGRIWVWLAAVAGLLVSWLHPWQGVELLVVMAALPLLATRHRRYLALIVPAVAILLPLIYQEVLAHADPSWHRFQSELAANTLAPVWALAAAFAPLTLLAACGIRRPRNDGEWMLLLLPFASFAVYLFGPNTSPHALAGLTLPLAVLAVRGWNRVTAYLRVPHRTAAALAAVAVGIFTLPALVSEAVDFHRAFARSVSGAISRQEFRLTDEQAAAMVYLERTPRAGGVLAPWLLSMSIPEFTGRQVYAGHQWWGASANLSASNTFFNPALHGRSAALLRRAILRQSRAVFVVFDCGAPETVAHSIEPVARAVRRFGCVRVYETNGR